MGPGQWGKQPADHDAIALSEDRLTEALSYRASPAYPAASSLNGRRAQPPMRKPSPLSLYTAFGASGLWLGGVGAFIWGYYKPTGLAELALHWQAALLAVWLLPVALIWLSALMARRAEALRLTTEDLGMIAWKLTQPEDTAAREVARVGRAVRHEIDAMNAGLENALGRVRTLESLLAERTSAVARITEDVTQKVDAIRDGLQEERDRLAELALAMHNEVEAMAESVSSRAGDVKRAVAEASRSFGEAQSALQLQIDNIHAATAASTEGARHVGGEIEREASRFEAVAEAALARADALSQRHERQRAVLLDAIERLREEGQTVEATLEHQRGNIEKLIDTLSEQAHRLDSIAEGGAAKLAEVTQGIATRLEEIGGAFVRESDKAKSAGELTNATLEAASRALEDLTERARATLAAESREAARIVESVTATAAGAAAKLAETLGEMRDVSGGALEAIDEAAERLRRHLSSLPAEVSGQTARLRSMLENELTQVLALSDKVAARTASIKAPAPEPVTTPIVVHRAAPKGEAKPEPKPEAKPAPQEEPETLLLPPSFQRNAPTPEPAEPARVTAPKHEQRTEARGETRQETRSEARFLARNQQIPRTRAEPKPMPAEPPPLKAERLNGHHEPVNGHGKDAPKEERPGAPAGGWLEFAKRLAGREKKDEGAPPWRLSSVLAAADKAHAEAPAAERARLQSMSLRLIEMMEHDGINLSRALEDDPPLDLWKRYLSGERNAFARPVLSLLGRDAIDRIAHRFGHDDEFRDIAERYVRQFEALLDEASTSDREMILTETYLTSQTGKVYLVLVNTVGRFIERDE
ncbi:MAG: hypothetical protein HXY22_06380 [Alphaproteobacteria bacterium]|nr:hypothetical protein [Alphaproteobacteria bacterium]